MIRIADLAPEGLPGAVARHPGAVRPLAEYQEDVPPGVPMKLCLSREIGAEGVAVLDGRDCSSGSWGDEAVTGLILILDVLWA